MASVKKKKAKATKAKAKAPAKKKVVAKNKKKPTAKKKAPAAAKKKTTKASAKKKKVAASKSKKAKPQRLTFETPETIPPERSISPGAQPAYEIVYEPSPDEALPTPARVLSGHTQFVQALAFTSDSKLLVTGSEDGSVRVWDVETGENVATSDAHGSAVNSLAFTADGKQLLTSSDDQTVKLWNIPSLDVVRTFEGHSDYVSEVAPAGATRAVSSSRDGSVRVWNLDTGECLHTMDHGGWVSALGATRDGRFAVAGCDRNVIRMWNLQTGKVEKVLLDASGDYIGDVMGFTLAAENKTGVGHLNAPKSIVFAPDDRTFVSTESDLIEWDTETGAERARIEGDGWPMGGMAFFPDRASLPNVDAAERGFLQQLRIEPDNQAARAVYGDWLEERGRQVEAATVRRHGPTRLAFVAAHGTVHVFDLASKGVVAQTAWDHGDVHNVAVSPDGKWGASGSDKGPVGLWDLDALVRRGLPNRHVSFTSSVMASDNGHALTGSSDRTVRLWSLDGRKSVRLPIEEGLFVNILFTPDGALALTMGDKGILRVFDGRTGELKGIARYADEEGHHPFNKTMWLRDGRTLIVGAVSGPMSVWSLEPFRERPVLFNSDGGHVIGIDADEDNDLIVTSEFSGGSDPMCVKFWSLSERKLKKALKFKPSVDQYGAYVKIVGDRVVIGTSVGGVLVLDRESGEPLHAIRLSEDHYYDRGVVLPGGRIAFGDAASTKIVDVNEGTIVDVLNFGGSGTFRNIGETTRVLSYSEAGIAEIDLATASFSALMEVPESPHDIGASTNGEFIATTYKSEGLLGAPMVLRRVSK
jgi:uncharacterized protein (TIGR02996 family)